jgi:hypothetical protein
VWAALDDARRELLDAEEKDRLEAALRAAGGAWGTTAVMMFTDPFVPGRVPPSRGEHPRCCAMNAT